MLVLLVLLFLLLLVVLLGWSLGRTRETFVTYTNEPYDVYMINLDRHIERLNHFESQIAQSDLARDSFIRVAAEEGSALDIRSLVTKKAFQEIEDAKTKKYRTKHYQLTAGGVGCYMSHLKTFDMILASDKEFAMVFEDDATVHTHMDKEFRRSLQDIPADWDIILLGYFCNDCQYKKKHNKVSRFFGTHAYVINRKGIEKIMKYINVPIDRQIDAAMSDLAESRVLNVYATKIKYARQQNSKFGTSIQIPIKRVSGVDPWERT